MYGLLLEMLAKGANLTPGRLIGQLGDCHLYNDHMKQTVEFLSRSKRVLPTLDLDYGIFVDSKNHLHIPELNEIKIVNYNPLPLIKAPLSVGI